MFFSISYFLQQNPTLPNHLKDWLLLKIRSSLSFHKIVVWTSAEPEHRTPTESKKKNKPTRPVKQLSISLLKSPSTHADFNLSNNHLHVRILENHFSRRRVQRCSLLKSVFTAAPWAINPNVVKPLKLFSRALRAQFYTPTAYQLD